MQFCKLVKTDSGYKIFNNSETQNYAVKEDHIIVYDDYQSLKEKVNTKTTNLFILKKNIAEK